MAGTKVVLRKVDGEVKKQGKEIEGFKGGLDEVSTRVDAVKVDVDNTKERVEEVDKKVVETLKLFRKNLYNIQRCSKSLLNGHNKKIKCLSI